MLRLIRQGAAYARPVVLIHGFCEDAGMWSKTVEHLDNYNLLLVDLPGYGQSAPQDCDTIAGMARTVLHTLENAEVDHFFVFGHSLGGYVALEMAYQKPESVKGIGLIHSHPFEDPPEVKAKRLRQVEFIRNNGTEKFVAEFIPLLFTAQQRSLHFQAVRSLVEHALSISPDTLVRTLKAMHDRPDRNQVLSRHQTMLVVGDQDPAFLPSITDQLIGAEVEYKVILRGEGHMTPFTKPQLLAHHINRFLSMAGYGAPQ